MCWTSCLLRCAWISRIRSTATLSLGVRGPTLITRSLARNLHFQSRSLSIGLIRVGSCWSTYGWYLLMMSLRLHSLLSSTDNRSRRDTIGFFLDLVTLHCGNINRHRSSYLRLRCWLCRARRTPVLRQKRPAVINRREDALCSRMYREWLGLR